MAKCAMGVSRFALWATATALIGTALIATGCGGGSSDVAEPPRNTVPEKPLFTEPRQVLPSTIPKPPTTPPAPSTTIQFVPDTTTTIAPAPTSSIPILESIDGLTAQDISDAMAAAVAAQQEWSRQLVGGFVEVTRLAEHMEEGYAASNAALLEEINADNRRFQAGTFNEFRLLSAEPSPKNDGVLAVLLCTKNNSAEYRTNGTPDTSDDELIQNDLVVSLKRVFMAKQAGQWKQIGISREADSRCDAVFS
jgi:hypothetical protein